MDPRRGASRSQPGRSSRGPSNENERSRALQAVMNIGKPEGGNNNNSRFPAPLFSEPPPSAKAAEADAAAKQAKVLKGKPGISVSHTTSVFYNRTDLRVFDIWSFFRVDRLLQIRALVSVFR